MWNAIENWHWQPLKGMCIASKHTLKLYIWFVKAVIYQLLNTHCMEIDSKWRITWVNNLKAVAQLICSTWNMYNNRAHTKTINTKFYLITNSIPAIFCPVYLRRYIEHKWRWNAIGVPNNQQLNWWLMHDHLRGNWFWNQFRHFLYL